MYVYVVYETEERENIYDRGTEDVIKKIISVRATEDAARSEAYATNSLGYRGSIEYKKMVVR